MVYVTSRNDDLVATFEDGEPVCAQNFTSPAGFSVSVCVAAADGTCMAEYTR
jgi:hypothetical protein